MLVNSDDILYMAKYGLYGIGQFNIQCEADAVKIINTSVICNMPVIIGVSDDQLHETDHLQCAPGLKRLAELSPVPVVLHYESDSFENCIKALNAGYTSVMFYDPLLDDEKYFEDLKLLARTSHVFKATCEGQCGYVPAAKDTDFEGIRTFYTDTEKAAALASETDIDVLSVSVGNAYGTYPYKPMLDIKRIIDLSQSVKIPLSLHGSSGLHPFDILHAVGNGISKVCCFTDIKDPKPITDPGQTDDIYPEDLRGAETDLKTRAIADRIVLYQNR